MIIIALVLLFVSTTFAGERVFSDSDLEKYSEEPMFHKETIEKYEDKQENININKKNEVITQSKYRIDSLEDRLKGSPPEGSTVSRNLSGETCDVISFTSSLRTFSSRDEKYGRRELYARHFVDVRIKSKHSFDKWIEKFYIVAFFENRDTHQTSQLQPAKGDSTTLSINPYMEYTGHVIFDADYGIDIVSMGCFVKEGL